jgi:hypothetical protein
MRRLVAPLAVGALVLALLACSEKFRFPNDLPSSAPPGSFDTAYVLVTPTWTSANGVAFNRPTDIVVGNDLFIYICDTNNDRIVKMTEQGAFVEEYSIVHPVAVTQDRAFDLLAVCGNYMELRRNEIDTTLTDTTHYGNAIYRHDYFGADSFVVAWRADSPYSFVPVQGGTRPVEAAFWGIVASPFATKDYYVADFILNRIIRFSLTDQPLEIFIGSGRGIGITEFPVDLYTYEIAGLNYLVYGQGFGNLGVQPVTLPNGIPLFDLVNEDDTLPEMVRFNHRGFKDVAVDERSNFYVLIEKLDPVLNANLYFHKFNRRGEHLLSFGTEGSGERQFNLPSGIDYLNGVIYIADAGNNRIVRYTLATAVQE